MTTTTKHKKLTVDPKTVELIERVVYHEARGEDVEGRNAVRAVIYNRLASGRFGGSILSVLNQKNAFQPVKEKGRGDARRLKVPTKAFADFKQEHLAFLRAGVDPTNGATFFQNEDTAKNSYNDNFKGLRIGRHTFYDHYNGNKVEVPDFSLSVRGFKNFGQDIQLSDALLPLEAPKKVETASLTTPAPAATKQEEPWYNGFLKELPLFSSSLSSNESGPVEAQKSPASTGSEPALKNQVKPVSGQNAPGSKEESMFSKFLPLFNAGGLVEPDMMDPESALMAGAEPSNRNIKRDLTTAADIATDFVPIVGELKSGYQAINAYNKGDYGDAAINALGAIPLLGTVGRAGKAAIKGAEAVGDIIRSDVPSGLMRASDKVMDAEETSVDAYKALGLDEKSVEAWKKANLVKNRQAPVPEVKAAAEQLRDGAINSAQYREVVSKFQPIVPFTDVPKMPSLEDIASALKDSQVKTGIVGVNKSFKDGEKVASRLDIPAYNSYDTWIVSLHDGTKSGGNAIGYAQTANLKNVEFKSSSKGALNIATEKTDKSTIARIYGDWANEAPEEVYKRAQAALNDPDWVQVGMNPYRHSYFYDKVDGLPVVSADEVIQVGPLVMAKGVKKASPDDPMFKVNPKDPESPTFYEGGLAMPDYGTVLRQYSDVPFVDRINNPDKYPLPDVQSDEKGANFWETHRMGASPGPNGEEGEWYVFPTVILENGKYKKMENEDMALERAIRDKDFIVFDSKEQALDFSENYKPEEFKKFYEDKLMGKEYSHGGMPCSGMMAPDEAMGYDEETGNPIPPGSTAENVRDDIPAMLSEGEYVVPADVVKWHGLKTFMDLRSEAKMGLMSMYHEGQIHSITEGDMDEEDVLEEEVDDEPKKGKKKSDSKATEEPDVLAEEDSAEEGDEELPPAQRETPEGNVVMLPSPDIETEYMEAEMEDPEYASEYVGDQQLILIVKADPSMFRVA